MSSKLVPGYNSIPCPDEIHELHGISAFTKDQAADFIHTTCVRAMATSALLDPRKHDVLRRLPECTETCLEVARFGIQQAVADQ